MGQTLNHRFDNYALIPDQAAKLAALQQSKHPVSKEPILRIRPLEIEALGLGGIQLATQCTAATTMPPTPAAALVPSDVVQPAGDMHFDDSQADRLSLSDASVGLGEPEEP